MDQSKITVRYAKALFELAKEKDQLSRLKTDMELVLSVAQSSPEFVLLLESPVIKSSKKTKIIDQIFSSHLNPLSMRFLELIVTNKREIHIPGMCRNFLALIRNEQGIRTAVLTSAIPMKEEAVSQLRSILEHEFHASLEMTEKVNPELLGGFVLRVDDQQYDASTATRLKKVKESLLRTEIK